MRTRILNWVLARPLPFSFFICLSLCYLLLSSHASAIESVNSSIDLSTWDGHQARAITEPWDFYWNSLLDSESKLATADQHIPVGQEWSSLRLSTGQASDDIGAASYRTVLNNLKPGNYVFWLDDVKSSASITALNAQGHILGRDSLGTVALNSEAARPARGRLQLSFAVDSPQNVILLLRVANFVRGRGGHASTPPMLATAQVMTHTTFVPLVGDIFSIGLCFAVGIYCLMIFMQRPQEKSFLYMVILCSATVSRILGTSQLLFQLFPGWAEALFTFRYRAEYLAMFGASLQLHFTYQNLGKDPQKASPSLQVLDGIAALSALLVLVTPVGFYTRFLPLFEAYLVACFLWLMVFLSRSMRHSISGLSYLIWGTLIQALTVMHDVFFYTQSNVWLAPYGSSLFLLLQAQFVARGLAESHRQSEELTQELKVKQQEILDFNSSLESKIKEKTRDIHSILENTKVGLFSIDGELKIHQDYSLCLETILEQRDLQGHSILDLLLLRSDLNADERDRVLAALRFSLGMERRIFEANFEYLPRQLTLQFSYGLKHLELEWSPLLAPDKTVERILVSLHDVTSAVLLRQEAEEGRQHLRRIGQIVAIGQQRCERFLQEAEQRGILFEHQLRDIELGRKEAKPFLEQIFIRLHTLKASSRMLKLSELADAYHSAEDVIATAHSVEATALPSLRQQLARLDQQLQLYRQAFTTLTRSYSQLEAAQKGLHPLSLQGLLLNFQAFASELARDLGKVDCKLDIDLPEPIVLEEDFFHALSSALVHIIQNAIDHGLETIQERAAAGKPAYGSLLFFLDDNHRLGIADDGAGIKLDHLLPSSRPHRLQPEEAQNLVEQLFQIGFSTKTEVTQISGRGVGMHAVRLLLEEVGSSVQLVPLRIEGQHLRFYFAVELKKREESRAQRVA